jgi:MFS family permease
VNVALPALVRQTGPTTTDLQWVVDAYNLVFAALVLAAGSMSDRPGRKGMLLAGLSVFGADSLAGSLATSTRELTGARAVMGLGAAMMFPATFVAADQRLHRPARAGRRDRPVGSHDRSRHRHRPHHRRMAAGALLVGQRLRIHGPGGGRGR